ncbi:MAG: hypothetical protein ACRESZ_15015 [Methylococcales bacterium]
MAKLFKPIPVQRIDTKGTLGSIVSWGRSMFRSGNLSGIAFGHFPEVQVHGLLERILNKHPGEGR